MTIPGSIMPLLLRSAAPTEYQISRSVRFNSSDSAYLSRTPASAGNRKTWTLSFWIKRCKAATEETILDASATGQYPQGRIGFTSGDVFNFFWYNGSTVYSLDTPAVFRDFSAWYHIVVAFDSTQATSSNRTKIYVNGIQQTVSGSYVAQNTVTDINNAVKHVIGYYQYVNQHYVNSYLADVHLVDGQALTPSSFTETDATTGQLIPKAYTGSYNVGAGAVNGFHLPFSDNSTAAALGTDTSGNSNTWTVNNISVAAGAGNDSLVDTPTSYGTDTGAGGEVRGNYCTWNPLKKVSSATAVNGNLAFTVPTDGGIASTFAVSSGKWYWEVVLSSGRANLGLATTSWDPAIYPGYTAQGWSYSAFNGNKIHNASSTSYGASFTTGDVIGVAFDADAGTLTFYKNGASQGQAFSGITGAAYQPALGADGGTTGAGDANFGQRPFAYTAPSGFKALCDTNLPAPVVAQPSTVFDAVTYTGNGGTQTIAMPGGFGPDLVWIKIRNTTHWHVISDTVRGATKALNSNATNAEGTDANAITAFNSGSFSVGSTVNVNENNGSLVAWCWDAGTTTASNSDGSITSSVRANASAGFSIVTYTGNGSDYPTGATVGHGLGVVPQFVIVKSRGTAGTNWAVWHSKLTAADYTLLLNDTGAAASGSNSFNRTLPTSTVFSVGQSGGGTRTNENGVSHVAYCFAPVAGYSSAFSYSGNGSTDGPAVWLGFRPRLVLIKCSSSAGINWVMMDAARNTYNVVNARLFPNTNDPEYTNNDAMDFLANGFKIRTVDGTWNSSGATYIGFAWAESPFQYARAR